MWHHKIATLSMWRHENATLDVRVACHWMSVWHATLDVCVACHTGCPRGMPRWTSAWHAWMSAWHATLDKGMPRWIHISNVGICLSISYYWDVLRPIPSQYISILRVILDHITFQIHLNHLKKVLDFFRYDSQEMRWLFPRPNLYEWKGRVSGLMSAV